MSRAVTYEKFGGPEVLEMREVPEPHASVGEVRVRVTVVGLNPMDWLFVEMPEVAASFGISLPAGFGCDFAGVVDEIGADTEGFAVGDRVYGGSIANAVADYVIVSTGPSAMYRLMHTPQDISDEVAAAIPTPGLTAAAAIGSIGVAAGDTVLVGGAAGGVGVIATQLAKIAGARVIGTASRGTFEFLKQLGVEPVEYGDGLGDRVRALAPDGITAATDLFGTDAADTALALGVPAERISTIATGPNPSTGVRATGGAEGTPSDLERITAAISADMMVLPIAARFTFEQVHEAVALQATRHVHGKVVLTSQ